MRCASPGRATGPADVVAFQVAQRSRGGKLEQASDVARIIFGSERRVLPLIAQLGKKAVQKILIGLRGA